MRKILLLGFIVWSFQTFAQTDSISISAEEPDSVDVKYDRIYKLFIEENNQEIRHLWKVDVLALRLNEINVSYEQKIGNLFSCETAFQYGFTLDLYRYNLSIYRSISSVNNYAPINSEYLYHGYMIGGFEKLKYYYNLKKRNVKGKNTNGFSGNYFSLHFATQYGNGHFGSYISHPYLIVIHDETFVYGYGLGYGLQRRIGNIGYLESSISLGAYKNNYTTYYGYDANYFNTLDFTLNLNLNIGFSIDSFSHLKKMLKK